MYILYSKVSAKTGKLLKKVFECNGGNDPPENETVLNYGSSLAVSNEKVFNSPSKVRDNANKTLSIFKINKAGVTTPKVYTPLSVLNFLDDLPIVGRQGSHRSGSGFNLCMNERGIQTAINNNCSHFLKFVPTVKEYRVHVFDGVASIIQEKTQREKAHSFICTHSKGWSFRLCNSLRETFPPFLRQEAIQAVRAVGLVFGAVDVGVTHKNECYVFEVNSAPSLEDESTALRRFKTYAERYIENNY